MAPRFQTVPSANAIVSALPLASAFVSTMRSLPFLKVRTKSRLSGPPRTALARSDGLRASRRSTSASVLKPSIRSMPSPARKTNVSIPPPPDMVSFPAPPVMMSLPLVPTIQSSPALCCDATTAARMSAKLRRMSLSVRIMRSTPELPLASPPRTMISSPASGKRITRSSLSGVSRAKTRSAKS